VTDAERLLTAQAQQQVSLERELVQLRALVTDLGYTQDSYRNYR